MVWSPNSNSFRCVFGWYLRNHDLIDNSSPVWQLPQVVGLYLRVVGCPMWCLSVSTDEFGEFGFRWEMNATLWPALANYSFSIYWSEGSNLTELPTMGGSSAGKNYRVWATERIGRKGQAAWCSQHKRFRRVCKVERERHTVHENMEWLWHETICLSIRSDWWIALQMTGRTIESDFRHTIYQTSLKENNKPKNEKAAENQLFLPSVKELGRKGRLFGSSSSRRWSYRSPMIIWKLHDHIEAWLLVSISL